MLELLRQISLIDGLALGGFIAAWWGYAAFARRRAASSGSLLATTNRIPPAVDDADDVARKPGHRWRRRAKPFDQPIVLCLDDHPDHRRAAGAARRHRRGGEAGPGNPVRGAHDVVRVRSEAVRADARTSSTRSFAYGIGAAGAVPVLVAVPQPSLLGAASGSLRDAPFYARPAARIAPRCRPKPSRPCSAYATLKS